MIFVFLRICLFHLSCLISWHKVVQRIPLLSIIKKLVIMFPLSFWQFVPFFLSVKLTFCLKSLLFFQRATFDFIWYFLFFLCFYFNDFLHHLCYFLLFACFGFSLFFFFYFSWSWRFSSVQSLSHVLLIATRWTAHQASLSITNSQSLLKPMSIESVMPSNHLILCCPLLLLHSIFPSISVFPS